ncbi:hemolysin family protein [Phreatobacter sp.]|uniref:hemolysin family protein n=1 Tax=Phreatobacter sp. TaxID=1966341 RepID=UPI0022C1A255|nr:hemolysin family protein [Phreatobacter sp.]MCZ8313952.1 hemolysin family protein [Phreatobacter sp.]
MPDPSDSRYRTTAAEAATTPISPTEATPEGPRAERGPDRHERWIDRLLGRLRLRSSTSARQNLEDVLEDNAPAAAGFTPEERSMLRNILDLRESRVNDLAQPRADIMAVQKDISLAALMQAFEDAGHTRLIVFDDTLDDPVGMVHIKDLVKHLFAEAKKATRKRRPRAKVAEAPDASASKPDAAKVDAPKVNGGLDLGAVDLSVPLAATRLIRPILFVPPSMPAIDLLARMQATRIQLALVIDEYGGTDGLIAMEDIVESIVGDIEDEHDVDDGKTVAQTADGAYVADARARLEEVREVVGPDFDPGAEVSEEVDTLGGYLTVLAGHVPVRGELLAGPAELEFEIIDADPRRVKRVKITRGRGLISRPAPVRGRRRDEEDQAAAAALASDPAPAAGPAAAMAARSAAAPTDMPAAAGGPPDAPQALPSPATQSQRPAPAKPPGSEAGA